MADIPDIKVQSSLQYLEEGMGLQCISRLGSGSFGDVYKMKDAKRNREVAVKLVEISEVYPLEWALWSRLHYKHIVPLLRVVDMSECGIRGYVMPLQPRSLMGAVRGSSLAQVRRWLMREVLKALEYLRRRGMCHLDVKSDNVLISDDERALLCDFTFIRVTTNGKVKRRQVGLPWIYCPPQLCFEEGCERVDGERVDLWGFGALSLEVLTGHPIRTRTDSGGPLLPWKRDVFPFFRDALQEPTFFEKLRRSFPSISPLDEERLALDFVHGFLMTNPKKRVKAASAMSHKFLGKGRKVFQKQDPIWMESVEKGGETPDEKTTFKRKTKKGIRERLTVAWKRVKTLFKKKDRSSVEQVAPDAVVKDSPLEGGSIKPTSPVPPGDAATFAGNTKKWASAVSTFHTYRALLASHIRSW